MTGIKEYGSSDAVALAAMVKKGDLSPLELLEEAIARAEALNPKLNAIVLKHYDEARSALQNLPDGALKGVPFLLKDLHLGFEGTRTTSGTQLLRDAPPAPYDSTLTERFRKAGLVIFGKTASPEFGLTGTTESLLYGETCNPWNLKHSSGGSSGGASAAVAAGILPAAHASDGGGSIRIPAAACGLFGMKPSRGRVPIGPDRGEGWAGMSINHVVSRSVRDSAAILDAVCGLAAGDPYTAPHRERPYSEEIGLAPKALRIAVNALRPDGTRPEPPVEEALQDAAKLCASLGHEMEEARPALDVRAIQENQLIIIGAHVALAFSEMSASLKRPIKEEDVEAGTWRMAQGGKMVSGEAYAQAVNFIHALGRKLARFHERYDVYLCPTLAAEPPLLGELSLMRDPHDFGKAITRVMPYTALANMTGQPSMSVPLCWSKAGLPIGMMFTASYGREDMLFRLAAQLEEARPWKDKRPPLHA